MHIRLLGPATLTVCLALVVGACGGGDSAPAPQAPGLKKDAAAGGSGGRGGSAGGAGGAGGSAGAGGSGGSGGGGSTGTTDAATTDSASPPPDAARADAASTGPDAASSTADASSAETGGSTMSGGNSGDLVPSGTKIHKVTYRNYVFEPKNLTIKVGEAIEWGPDPSGMDLGLHRPTSTNAMFTPDNAWIAPQSIGAGPRPLRFTKLFNQAGTFYAKCTHNASHSGQAGERMTIKVE